MAGNAEKYKLRHHHYSDVTMCAVTSQITGSFTFCSTVCSGTSKKISKLRITGLCEGYPPVTGGFPSQRVSNAESGSIHIWAIPIYAIEYARGFDVLYLFESPYICYGWLWLIRMTIFPISQGSFHSHWDYRRIAPTSQVTVKDKSGIDLDQTHDDVIR